MGHIFGVYICLIEQWLNYMNKELKYVVRLISLSWPGRALPRCPTHSYAIATATRPQRLSLHMQIVELLFYRLLLLTQGNGDCAFRKPETRTYQTRQPPSRAFPEPRESRISVIDRLVRRQAQNDLKRCYECYSHPRKALRIDL